MDITEIALVKVVREDTAVLHPDDSTLTADQPVYCVVCFCTGDGKSRQVSDLIRYGGMTVVTTDVFVLCAFYGCSGHSEIQLVLLWGPASEDTAGTS